MLIKLFALTGAHDFIKIDGHSTMKMAFYFITVFVLLSAFTRKPIFTNIYSICLYLVNYLLFKSRGAIVLRIFEYNLKKCLKTESGDRKRFEIWETYNCLVEDSNPRSY